MKNIKRYYNVIERSLFRDGKLSYDRLQDALVKLCDRVHTVEITEDVWFIGEGNECYFSDLIIGAYWHFTEWHAGQNSKSYATLCVLGRVFNPGMTSCENDNVAYMALNAMAEEL